MLTIDEMKLSIKWLFIIGLIVIFIGSLVSNRNSSVDWGAVADSLVSIGFGCIFASLIWLLIITVDV